MPDTRSWISKVTLPSGNTYYLKDEGARELIEALSSSTSFLGITTTPLYDQAATSEILVDGATKTPANGSVAIYGKREFIYIKTGENTGKWSEFGSLELVDITTTTDNFLRNVTVGSVTQPTVTVTPSTTKLSATASGTAVGADGTANAITGFGAHTKDNALGIDATFTTEVTPSNTIIKATASGTAVGANGTAAAVTGYTPTTGDFVTSVTADKTKKLVTTSITPTNGTDTATLITNKTEGKLVTTSITGVSGSTSASKATEAASQTTADGTTTSHQGTTASPQATYNQYILGDVSVSNETLSIKGITLDTQTTTQFTFSNVTVPTAASATTVATGAISENGTGGAVVQSFTTSDKTLAKVGTATTVATGSATTSGTGAAVVTDVTIGETAEAITDLGTPATQNVLTGVTVTAQPTITLASGSGTGSISVVTGISGATTVVDTPDTVAAITALGTPTTAAALTGVKVTTQPTVTLNTGSTGITVATGITNATATAPTVTLNTTDKAAALTSATLIESGTTPPPSNS